MTGRFLLLRLRDRARLFLAGTEAISITEYGMLVAFLALVIIAVVILTGGNLSAWFAAKTNSITTV